MSKKRNYLQWMCNKFGDFKITTHREDGSWTKHVSVLWVWENLEKEGWRFEKANNRTSLEREIILDLDPEKNETSEEVKKKAEKITSLLDKYNLEYRYFFSGSRGYHWHILSTKIGQQTNRQLREKYKQKLISIMGCELLKASERTTISLEFEKHWKSGNPKTLLKDTTRIDWEGF